jgi:REP element-mobilizing transposase RayT
MTVAKIAFMRSRLTRLDEIYPGYSIYFITICTQKRQDLLTKPVLHAAFIQFCSLARDRKVHVGRYVIMPDHIHFFVEMDDGRELSVWMKSLKNSLSKALRQLGNESPH